MSVDHFRSVIETLQGEVTEKEREAVELKKLINSLCVKAKLPAIYSEADLQATHHVGQFRTDQFYGQPLASAVREIMTAGKAAGRGAMTVNDIYSTLIAGGFKFDTSNEDNAKRGLRISLSKNTVAFHKLPNGNWGLREWYPNIKEPKAKVEDDDNSAGEPGAEGLGKDGEDGVMFTNKKTAG